MWGKTLGALFGYLLAGPAGAVFGILIGNFFDIGLNHHLHNPYQRLYRRESQATRYVFFSCLFKVMGHIAKTDGRVNEQEIEFARQIIKELGLKAKEKQLAIAYFNQGKEQTFQLNQQLNLLMSVCQHKRDLIYLFADSVFNLASKGPLNIYKQNQLNIICLKLGYKPAFNQQGRARNDSYHDFNDSQTHTSSPPLAISLSG